MKHFRYPAVYLKDFIGEKSHWNHSPFNSGKEQPIAVGDLRQLVTEFCIIPLSSLFLRESTPFVRSLLLAGLYFFHFEIFESLEETIFRGSW